MCKNGKPTGPVQPAPCLNRHSDKSGTTAVVINRHCQCGKRSTPNTAQQLKFEPFVLAMHSYNFTSCCVTTTIIRQGLVP